MLYQGDDYAPKVQLTKDGVPFSISIGAIVKAMIINIATLDTIGPIICSPNDPGANWATSLVVPIFPKELTQTIQYGRCILEIQVVDITRQTFQTFDNVIRTFIP